MLSILLATLLLFALAIGGLITHLYRSDGDYDAQMPDLDGVL
ncbi:MAG: hypothetical protein ACLGPL_00695 [Acidobacteriota bacterium]